MALQRKYVQQINDWLKWWNWHSDAITRAPLERRVDFCLKGLNGAYQLLAELSREAERIDGRRASESGIILPKDSIRW